LIGIVGTVGSGKSTFLMGLLGEIRNIKGKISVNGKVFYVSQEPWIFAGSIKENILFGQEYDQRKFNRIVDACCLKNVCFDMFELTDDYLQNLSIYIHEKDFKNFEYQENTMIGDKGVNLSGGQRARINLARAMYYDADIYLLDDPFSALDTTVGESVFNK
jgi:ATP-binding cassette subfamily C (CFTR/MRP) protein 4